jgi:hypothetical protein
MPTELITWSDLASKAPELARFGAARFATAPCYLTTIRHDGSPRVHPVTPIVSLVGLHVFMESASPAPLCVTGTGSPYTTACPTTTARAESSNGGASAPSSSIPTSEQRSPRLRRMTQPTATPNTLRDEGASRDALYLPAMSGLSPARSK